MALVAPFSGAAWTASARAPWRARAWPSWWSALLSLTQLPVTFALPDLVWRLMLLGLGQGCS